MSELMLIYYNCIKRRKVLSVWPQPRASKKTSDAGRASDSHRPTGDAAEIVLISIINESTGDYIDRSE